MSRRTGFKCFKNQHAYTGHGPLTDEEKAEVMRLRGGRRSVLDIAKALARERGDKAGWQAFEVDKKTDVLINVVEQFLSHQPRRLRYVGSDIEADPAFFRVCG